MTPSRRWIWILGTLAMLGAAGGMVADALSLWVRVGTLGEEFIVYRGIPGRLFVLLSHKSSASLLAGSLLGIVALPFHMCGFYLMAAALEPAGNRKAWAFFAAACFMAAVGSGFHGSIALVGEAARAGNEALFLKMMDLWIPWWWMMTLGFLAVSGFLLGQILSAPTRYPRWTAWFCPATSTLVGGVVLLGLIRLEVSLGLVWFLAICGINLPLLVFHAVTLWVLLGKTNH